MIVNCAKVGRGMRGDFGAHIGGPHPFGWLLREGELLAVQPPERLDPLLGDAHAFSAYPLIQRGDKSAKAVRLLPQSSAEQSANYRSSHLRRVLTGMLAHIASQAVPMLPGALAL